MFRSPHAPLDIPRTPLAELVLAGAAKRGSRAALIDASTGRTTTYGDVVALLAIARLGAVVTTPSPLYEKVRRVEFVDAIPKSPSGKILRRLLKDRPVTP